MYSEPVEVLRYGTIQCASDGAEVITWSESSDWERAADYNQCIVHIHMHQASATTGLTLTIYAQDATARVFAPITLSNNTLTAVGVLRVVIPTFGRLLKIGVGIQHSTAQNDAVVSLEYTLKQD